MREYFRYIIDLLNYNLFALGDAKITPLSILYLILLTLGLVYLSGKLKDLLVAQILDRTSMARGARQAIGTIARYLVLFIGFIIILQTVGIDLTTLTVIAGAVGIGIGFGLQNIASNFISGLIVLLERPIQVGDRIEANKVNGEVMAIGPRSTRIKTNDNVTVIIPNSKLVSENVVNWSYKNDTVRVRIPVIVDHDSNVDLVTRLLKEAANEHLDVAAEPPVTVGFLKFNEDGLFFELRAWSRVRFHKPGVLQSDLNYTILAKFREHGIVAPRSDRISVHKAEADSGFVGETDFSESADGPSH
jgi:small-conductance mechanosensitive channel